MHVHERDLLRLSNGLLHLYEPGLDAGTFAQRSTAFLAALVPAEFVVLGSLDRATGELDLFVDKPVSGFGEAMEAFAEHMVGFDLFNWNPAINEGRPFFRHDFLSDAAFKSSGMYADVYSRLGIDNHCAVLIPGVGEQVAFFGIERRGGPDFTETDRCLLEAAQSHLSNARSLAGARSEFGYRGADPARLQKRGLTNREADVLHWIAEGKSNDEIAVLLGLKLYTVKGYVKTIFQKIGAPNRLGAALWALRECHVKQDGPQSKCVNVR